nr:DNA helicase [Tanacetum cinerariifolium]
MELREEASKGQLQWPLGESSNVVGPSRPPIDEIQNYLKGRFRVTFKDRDRLESVVTLPGRKNTTLTKLLAYNEANEDGRPLTYLAFPSEFVWYDNRKSWSPRQNSKSSIGRLACVHLTSPQTMHDIFYPTCRAACEALGLLRDDNEWDIAMQEACVAATLSQLRFVFAHILIHCEELIFVYGHGGTGKTFLWKIIISTLRCEGKIVLVVASSSIASLLLPPCRISHSRFKLPIELTKESLCKVTKNSQLGKLLADTDLIIWDEAPMNDSCCFEALDRSLKDILTMPHHLFGGKSSLLGGDFRQTLPVKKGASKVEIVASCISQSELWAHFKVFTLKENMPLSRPGVSADEHQKDSENTNWMDIPLTYYLSDDEKGLSKLIDFINDQMTLRTPSAITLQEKAIVCPKNETADMINSKLLEMVQGETKTYLSHDEAIPLERDGVDTKMLYHLEHLNTLKFLGFPPNRLELKI